MDSIQKLDSRLRAAQIKVIENSNALGGALAAEIRKKLPGYCIVGMSDDESQLDTCVVIYDVEDVDDEAEDTAQSVISSFDLKTAVRVCCVSSEETAKYCPDRKRKT